MKTDSQLQRDVMEELKWQPFLKSSEIGVSVNEGVVTLSGFVDSYSQKKSAEKAALSVAGVKAVAEDIVVKLSSEHQKSDTEIAQAVLHALKWDTAVPEDKIKVKVDNGWVMLDGEVDWTYQREAVRTAVENLAGVRGISNLITLSPKVSVSDVKKKISAAFHRSAVIDSNNISIENVGNKIILSGSVRSVAEKQDAEHAAWNAPGVTSIDNRLEIHIPVFANEDNG